MTKKVDHQTHRRSEDVTNNTDDPIKRTHKLSRLLDKWASGEISYKQVKENYSNETNSSHFAQEPSRR